MIQATPVETVGYGALVRDRVCAQLAEGSLKANEMLRGVVAYGKQQIANCKLAVGSSVSICVHSPLTYSKLAMEQLDAHPIDSELSQGFKVDCCWSARHSCTFSHDLNRDDFDGVRITARLV